MLQFDFIWAFAVLPLPLLVFWLAAEFRDQGQALRAPIFERVVALTGKAQESGAVALRKNWFQKTVVLLSWILIVVALARPVWVGQPIVQEVSARDMLLVVDLSGSMAEEDFTDEAGEKISRLDAVKLVLGEFIEKRDGDRLGLAVFGNSAFPQATFTTDHETILILLDELQVGMAGPKTMIGDAIGLAIRLFEPATVPDKVVILLTDGNDTGSQMPVSRASEIAAENGITIHTIAMGDPEKVGENALDLDVLNGISSTTGGQSFTALDRESLEEVYATLDELEPQKLDTLSYSPKRQFFFYPLAGVLLLNGLLGLVLLVGTRRRRVQHA